MRNWDYRFTWTRDAAMAVRAGNLIGYSAEARDFFHVMRRAIDQHDRLQVMYRVDGEPVPVEEELPNLRGFGGSAPVRIGNGARDQIQLDSAGALVDAAHLYEHFGGTLTVRAWRTLQGVIDSLQKELIEGVAAAKDFRVVESLHERFVEKVVQQSFLHRGTIRRTFEDISRECLKFCGLVAKYQDRIVSAGSDLRDFDATIATLNSSFSSLFSFIHSVLHRENSNLTLRLGYNNYVGRELHSKKKR